MRQSWAMPPTEESVWNGKDFTPEWSKAFLYETREAADLALIGVALAYPEEADGYYSRTLNLIPVDPDTEARWKRGECDAQD